MRSPSSDKVKMLPNGGMHSRVRNGLFLSSDCSNFCKLVVICNVLLALYNFMCFSVPRQNDEPCVVILNNSALRSAAEKGLIRLQDVTVMTQNSPLGANGLPVFSQLKAGENGLTQEDPQSDEDTAPPSPMGMSTWTKEIRGDFTVLGNYIKAQGQPPPFNRSITYTTQATHEFFFPHIWELCDRWGGPISLAIYAPGTDLQVVHNKLAYLFKCSATPCVTQNVTFHVVYDNKHVPSEIPDDPQSYVADTFVDCDKEVEPGLNYRKGAKLTYPINVLRNAARVRAQTKYVLASDIELYPSVDMIPKFMGLIDSLPKNDTKPHVYTLPIFEVEKSKQVPRTKKQLMELYSKKSAIFFHKLVCDRCQNFPQRDKWISHPASNNSRLSVFATTKRRYDKNSWEPIYIGTNDEPLYEESLTWEGKRDKMSQMFELCLIDYDFRVLDGAFLCHAPGIKVIKKEEMQWRAAFVSQNNKKYPAILQAIKQKHPQKTSFRCL